MNLLSLRLFQKLLTQNVRHLVIYWSFAARISAGEIVESERKLLFKFTKVTSKLYATVKFS